jgi:hypothetical protein
MHDCSSFRFSYSLSTARAGRPHRHCVPRRVATAFAPIVVRILAALPAHAQHLVVVSSGDAPPDRQALAGIQRRPRIAVNLHLAGQPHIKWSTSMPRGLEKSFD